MTAPRFICPSTKKALAERGPSIHDGVERVALKSITLMLRRPRDAAVSKHEGHRLGLSSFETPFRSPPG